MKTHGILFNPEMGQALFEGRKTQTRRILKAHADGSRDVYHAGIKVKGRITNPPDYAFSDNRLSFSKIKTGDRIVAKERHWAYGHWITTDELTKGGKPKRKFIRDYNEAVLFEAPLGSFFTSNSEDMASGWYKRNSLFMPLADARTTAIITDARVQRLQDISAEDAIAEGIAKWIYGPSNAKALNCYGPACPTGPEMSCNAHGCWGVREGFRTLINSINGPDTWDSNPWVAAYTFERESAQ